MIKREKKPGLLYPISVLESERDNIHGLPKNRAEQLNEAIRILALEKMRDELGIIPEKKAKKMLMDEIDSKDIKL